MATDDTRTRLVDAAERLFAERGIDAVSLREITRESGARNAIALQYHFEDRQGVLDAIFEKHEPEIESRRHAILDEYEASGDGDLRRLAAALVRPLAAKLVDEGGRSFLRIYAEALDRPRDPRLDKPNKKDSLQRWRDLVAPHLDDEAARLHRRFTAILHTANELARRSRLGGRTARSSGRSDRDERLFTSYLVDVVTAILAAPVSEETSRLAAERDIRRRR